MERNPTCLLSKYSLWIFFCARHVLINEARKKNTWVIGPQRQGFRRKSMCKWTITVQTKSQSVTTQSSGSLRNCARIEPKWLPACTQGPGGKHWNAPHGRQPPARREPVTWVSLWVLPLPTRTTSALGCRCQMGPLTGIFPSTCSQQNRRHEGRKGWKGGRRNSRKSSASCFSFRVCGRSVLIACPWGLMFSTCYVLSVCFFYLPWKLLKICDEVIHIGHSLDVPVYKVNSFK